MLSLDVTFIESKNNSRVSGDSRWHVPHVTSLWCDIFTHHRHICIVVSNYEWISSYMSISIQICVRCNWLWCFGNTAIRLAVDSPHKRPLILCLVVFFVVSLSTLLKQQSICWFWKTASSVISYIFSLRFKVHPQILKFLREINNLINFSLRRYVYHEVCWEDLPGRNHIGFLCKCFHADLLWWAGLGKFMGIHFAATQAMRSVVALPGESI